MHHRNCIKEAGKMFIRSVGYSDGVNKESVRHYASNAAGSQLMSLNWVICTH